AAYAAEVAAAAVGAAVRAALGARPVRSPPRRKEAEQAAIPPKARPTRRLSAIADDAKVESQARPPPLRPPQAPRPSQAPRLAILDAPPGVWDSMPCPQEEVKETTVMRSSAAAGRPPVEWLGARPMAASGDSHPQEQEKGMKEMKVKKEKKSKKDKESRGGVIDLLGGEAKVVPNAPRGDSLEVGLTGSVEFFELSDEVDEENAKSEDALDEWYSKDVDLVQDEGDAELGARLEEQLGMHSDEEKLAKSVGDPSMLGVPAYRPTCTGNASPEPVGGWIGKAAKLPAVPPFPLLVEDKWQRLYSENAAVYAKMERVLAGRRLANDIMMGIIREKGTKEVFLEEVEFPTGTAKKKLKKEVVLEHALENLRITGELVALEEAAGQHGQDEEFLALLRDVISYWEFMVKKMEDC
ncbi:unnamed protein product, partial [Prorocentrum cordatum]